MNNLDKWVIGMNGSGKTLSMQQYAERYKDIKVFSNYPNLGTPINVNINVNEILKSAKHPLRMDQRLENLMKKGESDGFYKIHRRTNDVRSRTFPPAGG
jgi:hypothetical protein